jgi:hypothetical protein
MCAKSTGFSGFRLNGTINKVQLHILNQVWDRAQRAAKYVYKKYVNTFIIMSNGHNCELTTDKLIHASGNQTTTQTTKRHNHQSQCLVASLGHPMERNRKHPTSVLRLSCEI